MDRHRPTSLRRQRPINSSVFSSWLPRDQVKLLDRFPTRLDKHSDAFSTISLLENAVSWKLMLKNIKNRVFLIIFSFS